MRPDMITTYTGLTVKTQHSSLTESSDFANNTEDKRVAAFAASLEEYSHYQHLSLKKKYMKTVRNKKTIIVRLH